MMVISSDNTTRSSIAQRAQVFRAVVYAFKFSQLEIMAVAVLAESTY